MTTVIPTIIDLRDRFTRRMRTVRDSVRAFRTDLQNLRNLYVDPTVDITDKFSGTLRFVTKWLENIGSTVVEATVKIKDMATPVLKEIERMAEGLETQVAIAIGALSAAGGGIVASGRTAAQSDALVSSNTGLPIDYVTPTIDDIYYSGKGVEREGVGEILKAVKRQTDLTKSDLTEAVSIVATINSLDPESDPNEISRAFTAYYNAMQVSFKRTGDALAYIRERGGDQYQDLYDSVNEYASTYAKLDISPERLSSGFVAGVEAGGRNYDAFADSAREWGIRIKNAEKNTVEALRTVWGDKKTKQMFMDFNDGKIDPIQFLGEVSAGLDSMKNPLEKTLAQNALYGTLFEDNDKPIQAFFDGLLKSANTAGELDKQFKKLHDDDPTWAMTFAWLQLQKEIKNTGTTIIGELQPAFFELTKWYASKEGQKAFKEMRDSVKELAVTIGSKLLVAIRWIIENWEELFPVIKKVGSALIGLVILGRIVKLVMAIIPAFTFLYKVVVNTWRGLKLFGSALLWLWRTMQAVWYFILAFAPSWATIGSAILGALPFIAMVAGAFTALWAVVRYWDQIKEFLAGMWAWFKEHFPGLAGWIEDVVAKIGEVWDAFYEWSGLKDFLTPFIDDVRELIKLLRGDVDGLVNAIKNIKPPSVSWKGGDEGKKGFQDSVVGKAVGWVIGGYDGEHAKGISNIPFDGYSAKLHKGETVLPAEEAQVIRAMPSLMGRGSAGKANQDVTVMVTGNNTFNNGTDMDMLVDKTVKKITSMLVEDIATNGAGVYSV